MSIFSRKPHQTLEQEHTTLVSDLIQLEKALGSARQADILQKTEASNQKVWHYTRAIEACQIRLVRLSERIIKQDVVSK